MAKQAQRVKDRVGILGGGQLARMLALAAHPLGITPVVLSENASDPAAQVTRDWVPDQKANSRREAANLETLLSQVESLTFESEFFDQEPLKKLALKFPKVFIFPRPDLMQTLQDRRSQKRFLEKFRLPTAPWCEVKDANSLSMAAQILGFPFVVKKAQGGYDGYGTFFVRSEKDFAALKTKSPWPAIAEKVIHFRRELALMAFRSRRGDCAFFPLVETRQKDSRCDVVLGPIRKPAIRSLQARLKKALNQSDYVGALGVEMFETATGDWMINELAPRVHNTGHYSQQAMNFDQFQLHLLCGRNQPLPHLKLLAPAFVMTNLIGQGSQSDSSAETSQNLALNLEKTRTGILHWYGKNEPRKGRKMGHVNYIGANTRSLLKTALRERNEIETIRKVKK